MQARRTQLSLDRYDPHCEPDAEAWLAADQDERAVLVMDYHCEAGIKLERNAVHAAMHTIIETQIATGGEMLPVRVKIRQLMAQGLDRHDALHAVGGVMLEQMQRMVRTGREWSEDSDRYFNALRRLTARKWLRSG